jgi:hypothetical protein
VDSYAIKPKLYSDILVITDSHIVISDCFASWESPHDKTKQTGKNEFDIFFFAKLINQEPD